jgi:hypothetical protein
MRVDKSDMESPTGRARGKDDLDAIHGRKPDVEDGEVHGLGAQDVERGRAVGR